MADFKPYPKKQVEISKGLNLIDQLKLAKKEILQKHFQ